MTSFILSISFDSIPDIPSSFAISEKDEINSGLLKFIIEIGISTYPLLDLINFKNLVSPGSAYSTSLII